jgi:hypothetical protein
MRWVTVACTETYYISYTVNTEVLSSGNKVTGSEVKTLSSTGRLFYRVPEHIYHNGQIHSLYATQLPCTMTRQNGHRFVPSLYLRVVTEVSCIPLQSLSNSSIVI